MKQETVKLTVFKTCNNNRTNRIPCHTLVFLKHTYNDTGPVTMAIKFCVGFSNHSMKYNASVYK